MTPQPVGAPAYRPLPAQSPRVPSENHGKFAADLRAALSPREKEALEATFGANLAAVPRQPSARAATLGRHIDVQA
jgi:hypothetical protein